MTENLILGKLDNPYFDALNGKVVTMESITKANPLLFFTTEQLIRVDKLAGQYGLDGQLYIYRPQDRLNTLKEDPQPEWFHQSRLPRFYRKNGCMEFEALGVPEADGYWRKY